MLKQLLQQRLFQDWTGLKTVLMMLMMMKRRQRHWFHSRALGNHGMGQYPNMYLCGINFSLTLLVMTAINCFLNRLEDDNGSSRRTRLLRLCSYLQEKYKHMCRQERASIRQKRYRYAFRKALLHAASNNPDSAGQLIQELRGASQSLPRYSHKCYISQFCLPLWTNINTVWLNLMCW